LVLGQSAGHFGFRANVWAGWLFFPDVHRDRAVSFACQPNGARRRKSIIAANRGNAYTLEYLTFTYLFKLKKVANLKDSWLYQTMTPLFNKYKFFVLSFTSFLPIPSEPLRIYAITQKYSILLFMLAGFVGRIPRYFLLGYYGKDYVNSLWFLIAVFVFPGILVIVMRGAVSLYVVVRNRLAQERSV